MTPSDTPTSAWQRFRLAVLVPLARLRFLVILGAIGLALAKWDWLVAKYEKLTRPADTATAAADVEYFCPMHPTVVRDNNKEKCPICFMPLSKRQKGEATDEALPAGTVARVQLSPYRVVLAGVRTEPVAFQPVHREITTVGTVEFDERAVRTVAARFKGRIDKLFANQTGQAVAKGDPLASVYSPELVVTVQNLLDARKANNADGEANARSRLALWGVEADQIDEVLKAGKPITHLTVRSPITGHVVRKYPREGQYVDEGGVLFDVADLSTVWVQAQLYEEDLAFLPKGAHDPKTGLPDRPLPVEATTRGRPGETFTGKLTFVFPHVDPDSRTLTARFELANPDHELRPGMTATVRLRVEGDELPKLPSGKRLRVESGKVLAVPEAAVIDTGRQQVVYRESLPNTYDGVLVELGPKLTGADGVAYYPVLAGLRPGDAVAVGGAFLIDAETRLNPAAGSIYIGGGGTGGGKGPGPVRPSTPEDSDAKVTAALGKLPPEDRALAAAQKFCPVLEGSRLGSMGVPVKLALDGQSVFLCCKGCVAEAQENPARTRKRADELKARGPSAPTAPKPSKEEEKIRAAMAKLPPADRALAEAQKICPVTDEPLGVMGMPIKVTVKGQPVFVCCKGCDEEALDRPDETLRKVEQFKKGATPKK
ncbi:MAG TPA: efflux RND transporter periplasmic adaptor subunit [Gemmataceae bacterium]|nr:efflux RND transporter periplasmic adaptor subunit [Gemmataceae bacterium]